MFAVFSFLFIVLFLAFGNYQGRKLGILEALVVGLLCSAIIVTAGFLVSKLFG